MSAILLFFFDDILRDLSRSGNWLTNLFPIQPSLLFAFLLNSMHKKYIYIGQVQSLRNQRSFLIVQLKYIYLQYIMCIARPYVKRLISKIID